MAWSDGTSRMGGGASDEGWQPGGVDDQNRHVRVRKVIKLINLIKMCAIESWLGNNNV